jgi:maintenance of morphology protein 1
MVFDNCMVTPKSSKPGHHRHLSSTLDTAMGNYLFTLSPTFTQGLILGQLSILVLLYFILKYLFFDSKSALDLDASPNDDTLYRPTSFAAERSHADRPSLDAKHAYRSSESAEWLNTLLLQVCIIELSSMQVQASYVYAGCK